MLVREVFKDYLTEAIGSDNALVAFSAFDTPPSVSVRYNPFKRSERMEGRAVPWCAHGVLLDRRPVFTLDPLFHAGAYYVQDSSSMFVGHAFREMLDDLKVPEDRPVRVLDLCAAPGGKTTDLAASLREAYGDGFLLVSNEVMKARAGVLADNVALWGDPNVIVTSDDPSAFSSLTGFFDIIVTDVPCSGEGMFRKDEQAQTQWSEQNVDLCAARQKRILADVWPSLRSDGILIYSTCTFNRYENDDNVSWVVDELGAECMTSEDRIGGLPGVYKTRLGYSLVPGLVEGEGQYCSVLRKLSDSFTDMCRLKRGGKNVRKPAPVPPGLDTLLNSKVTFRIKGDTITAVPEVISDDVALLDEHMHVIAAGCALGVMKGKTLVPDADLSLSLLLADDAYPYVDVDIRTALMFLHRDNVSFPESDTGYLIVRYNGLPLGFVKNLGNRCNSLHPQSRRIRMDINI